MSSKFKHYSHRQKAKKAQQKKWEKKRKKWYNDTVWKGWRENDEPSPVKTYNIKDLRDD